VAVLAQSGVLGCGNKTAVKKKLNKKVTIVIFI
jgi:hypothetical protein